MKGILIGIVACFTIMVLPAGAANSYLDVSDGDRESYSTYKDVDNTASGDCYYVTARTYVGYPILGKSVAVNGGYSSNWTMMENKVGEAYSYGGDPACGIYYKLVTGPSYMSGSNWRLTGAYCP